jgi:hypothetical protein
MCTSVFIKAKAGATTNGMAAYNSNQFNNNGARAVGMVDASGAVMAFDPGGVGVGTATFTNVSGGSQILANGWTRVWVTGTATATGTKTPRLRSMKVALAAPGENYLGTVGDGYTLAFAQTEYGVSRPTSYKATTAAAASTSADSAIISDISWLNAAVGTLVVEHDCTSGVVLGSGANTVLSGAAGAVLPARATGKVAIAWSGTTSDLVYNGGANTPGVQPTFGADLRLLATSGATNAGHIKSLTYYPIRLSVAQIQALTAPASTAPAAGTWRVAAQRNVVHNASLSIAGTLPYLAFRWPAVIGSGARTKLRVSAGNWWINDAAGDNNTGNAITVESAVLVLVSTGEFAPIFWSGSRSVTLTDGQVKLNSDEILPSAFPSLAAGGVIPNLAQFEVRGKVKCASGAKLPVGRWGNENGAQCLQYDAAVTTMSAVDAIGVFTFTGTAAIVPTKGFSFVLEGPPVSGDPIAVVGFGDSIVEGVGSLVFTGSWFNKAATSLGAAYLQIALGGQSQTMFWKSVNAYSFAALGNVLVDNTGTNSQGIIMQYPLVYAKARAAGIRYILRPSLNVRSTSTDSFATNANQTATLVYIDYTSDGLASLAQSGLVDAFYKMNAVRDTGDKWLTNGVAQTYTVDGTHQQPAGDDLMATELQTYLVAAAAALS